jgi:3-phenylpropionate/trans-cinnamate dioxygenase ferredoxin subunit
MSNLNDLRWTPVGKVTEWEDGEGRPIQIGPRRLGVYRQGETFHALKDVCPHAGVALSQGPVTDGAVMCVGHGWSFSLTTGEIARGPAGHKVAVFPARVVNGTVEVGI